MMIDSLKINRSEDHMARNCDKPRNVSTVTCRNCDEVGHFSQDCTKPRDWSRVKCNNCGESKFPSPECLNILQRIGLMTLLKS